MRDSERARMASALRYTLRMSLELRVLGSSAGGGFPQWNCGCANCARARAGQLPARLQDSLAVSGDGSDWFLLNASPDVARQVEATRCLWPRAPRGSPIRGVVLTNGDLDHVLGLLLLRESHPLSVYCTAEVRAGLEQNSMLRTLMRFEGQLVWHELQLGREQELQGPGGERSGIWLRSFPAAGKPPLHLVASSQPTEGDNVGLSLRGSDGARAVYVSATSSIAPIANELGEGSTLLLDGTFWSETELIDAGLGRVSAREMAHLPIGGPDGSLVQCRGLRSLRRLFTHINNTNPILDPASEQHALLRGEGWSVAEDGMRLII
jgi:pyrroloquinoline quinone biosynthesis protein B